MPNDSPSQALARITPVQRMVSMPSSGAKGAGARGAILRGDPSPREKAAIIVRLLLSEGAQVPLSSLPDHMQAALTEQMGQMRLIDRATLSAVVEEFLGELEEVGLSFPGGIEGALTIMDGHISPNAANRLRRLAGFSSKADPWDRIVKMPLERLLPVIQAESTEVAAVMLSKMPANRSAELLGRLPGERARRVAYAMSMTGDIDPETVRRIGHALATQLDAQPLRAFEDGPVQRVGAILNVSSTATREDVLRGLEADDAAFAEQVRRAIFTFEHIPERLQPRDVPKVLRLVPQDQIVTAFAAAVAKEELSPVVDFLLSNISQRLAQTIREELETRGTPKEKDADDAMNQFILTIRQLEGAGEVVLIQEEED